jgi:protocatechuate 3,4-dioxygenase beta subunit
MERPNMIEPDFGRRRALFALVACSAAPAAMACAPTPRDALGPFYKSGMAETGDICRSARGTRLRVEGIVTGGPDCRPLAGAVVDVWQADGAGDYTLVDPNRRDDRNCLLRGVVKSDAEGRYAFLSIAPGEYPGRPRHIHYRVSAPGHHTLVTQAYFAPERGVPPALVGRLTREADQLVLRFDIALARN